jgi:hypothetical protein
VSHVLRTSLSQQNGSLPCARESPWNRGPFAERYPGIARRIAAPVRGDIAMSLWDKIRDKILPPSSKKNETTIDDLRDRGMLDGPNVGTGSATAAPPAQNQAPAGSTVDIEQVLEAKLAAKGNPDLNWRTSIVDLMKLLDIDSDLDNRKQLAEELGYTGDRDGSAEMNMWLHKEVMRRLAANGGNVPANLTD